MGGTLANLYPNPSSHTNIDKSRTRKKGGDMRKKYQDVLDFLNQTYRLITKNGMTHWQIPSNEKRMLSFAVGEIQVNTRPTPAMCDFLKLVATKVDKLHERHPEDPAWQKRNYINLVANYQAVSKLVIDYAKAEPTLDSFQKSLNAHVFMLSEASKLVSQTEDELLVKAALDIILE